MNQGRQHLSVSLGLKGVALSCEPMLEVLVVLNNAIVHQDDITHLMRVGIDLIGLAVGRPAGVGNTKTPIAA